MRETVSNASKFAYGANSQFHDRQARSRVRLYEENLLSSRKSSSCCYSFNFAFGFDSTFLPFATTLDRSKSFLLSSDRRRRTLASAAVAGEASEFRRFHRRRRGREEGEDLYSWGFA
uniref:Uncharacterized protein n=1 Tax=Ananas comosus var. bracteatus TaxID=296719 RepID=A0A6V7QSF9_ANACO